MHRFILSKTQSGLIKNTLIQINLKKSTFVLKFNKLR
jgi:hypothetical protein